MNYNLNLRFKPEFVAAEDENKNKCRCIACGKEVLANPNGRYPLYCEPCTPIKNIKDNWKPLGSGSVSRIFVIPSRNS